MSHAISRRRGSLAATAAALSLVAGALLTAGPAQGADRGSDAARTALKGTKPAWATERADRGSAADSAKVTVRVYLAGRDQHGLEAYAKAVSDPRSASYRHYLTPRQFKARYGATGHQRARIRQWLASAGLKTSEASEHYITATGTAAAVEKAFAVELHEYSMNGKLYRAPSAAASVPRAVSGAVLAITGLDNAPHRVEQHEALPPPGPVFRNSPPFSTYYGSNTDRTLPKAYGASQPWAVKGYTGKQLRASYAHGSSLTGKHVTVAITDAYASPTIAGDAARYVARNGDKPYRKGQLTQVLPADYNSTEACGADGWYGEETLDVEAVHAVAPDADIVYAGSASCFDNDFLDTLSKVVDNRLADIVSNSWGDIESVQTPEIAAAYDQIFQQGAVEGIGFYFSSGDNGDEVAHTGTKQVDVPANSPWVTAVGGTSLAVGRHGTYRFETGWGTNKALLAEDGSSWQGLPGAFTSGAGGGTSKFYAQPFYQRGVVPDALARAATGSPQRVVPDIAAVADPNTGFLVGQTQTFPDGSQRYSQYRIGGTSLAAPVIAGVQALAQQGQHGVPIGFANPAVYDRYGTAAYHDVTDHPLGAGRTLAVARRDYANGVDGSEGVITSLRTLGKDSSLKAVPGYDDVTGVGSPAAGYLKSYQHHH
ncbi:S53 family peptidase [Wenjunlia tyrosinilytica]|uniref:Serine protease n=1 Tax=Wenjunlia tyrosinilytica TaxID=1544741 RepID=A0A917ZPS1_9ACTN|nr:S53 family peptidase [Wenjunlia tyrosinilytica]GGO87838.1 serine protease [Wenjunlia tyrosinilytica]